MKVTITEKKLLDNYVYTTIGGDYASVINGIRYYWSYRKNDGLFQPKSSRENADCISYGEIWDGSTLIQKPKYRNNNHPTLKLL